jgi:hypothetical protein
LNARVIITTYNQHIRLLLPEPWLLLAAIKSTQVEGADIVMKSSVSRRLAIAGSAGRPPAFCRWRIRMWSSPCRSNWHRSHSATSACSTTCCFAPPPRPCCRSPLILAISVHASEYSPYSIPGARTFYNACLLMRLGAGFRLSPMCSPIRYALVFICLLDDSGALFFLWLGPGFGTGPVCPNTSPRGYNLHTSVSPKRPSTICGLEGASVHGDCWGW